jgi:hypothetical protein
MNDRPPVINIDVPKQPRPIINIDVPKVLPPVINLSPVLKIPEQVHRYPKAWIFDVEYGNFGRIKTVTATPKF